MFVPFCLSPCPLSSGLVIVLRLSGVYMADGCFDQKKNKVGRMLEGCVVTKIIGGAVVKDAGCVTYLTWV